jgi:hypothetical protein
MIFWHICEFSNFHSERLVKFVSSPRPSWPKPSAKAVILKNPVKVEALVGILLCGAKKLVVYWWCKFDIWKKATD